MLQNIIASNVKKYFEEDFKYAMTNPIIFGDFWATSSEEDIYYEDMQDFDVCKAITEEVCALI